MAKCNVKVEKTVHLTLDEGEARYLLELTQNYLGGAIEDEHEEARSMRERIFRSIDEAGIRTL